MGSRPSSGKIKVSTPSNIAFIKYWGKYGNQMPMNPSISMTLDKCRTEFDVDYSEGQNSVELIFEGTRNQDFETKLTKLYQKLISNFPILDGYHFKIKSRNTFPHSAGIASSASAMSAFALTLGVVSQRQNDLEFVSELARLCSGSACRSVYPDYAIWGESQCIDNSSQEHAIVFNEAHSIFNNMNDSIVIVDSGEKSVSSSAGHGLMSNHPYREKRVVQANTNFNSIIEAMRTGDLEKFGRVIENEALSLHALMLSSDPSYILLKPLSLQLIEEVKNMREMTNTPLYFTIDAGPNIHLIYPDQAKNEARNFIDNFCHKHKLTVIHDGIGKGPRIEPK
ncbi:MAG: diphosphomevalonate decarboxylase [Halobacteriovoraceae bacterium]|nr:diphosphomevalonate decarboxylase [Halobacteriovoraceae bacterium]|tara:strand:+ start:2924 stop:3937 length:1014 start_codon:yes stop_codon:yes gene_type:complete